MLAATLLLTHTDEGGSFSLEVYAIADQQNKPTGLSYPSCPASSLKATTPPTYSRLVPINSSSQS